MRSRRSTVSVGVHLTILESFYTQYTHLLHAILSRWKCNTSLASVVLSQAGCIYSVYKIINEYVPMNGTPLRRRSVKCKCNDRWGDTASERNSVCYVTVKLRVGRVTVVSLPLPLSEV